MLHSLVSQISHIMRWCYLDYDPIWKFKNLNPIYKKCKLNKTSLLTNPHSLTSGFSCNFKVCWSTYLLLSGTTIHGSMGHASSPGWKDYKSLTLQFWNKRPQKFIVENSKRTWGMWSHDRGTIAPPSPGRQGTDFTFLQFLHNKVT